MNEITCISKTGEENTFYYDVSFDELDKKWLVRVVDDPDANDGNSFEIHYKPLNNYCWQQTGIYHQGIEKYASKGIPDTMIPEISKVRKVVIISSPKVATAEFGQEAIFRSEDADTMWNRLVDKNIAGYSKEANVYFVMNYTP
ncbi:MAG: hypothetical protein CME32_04730 [Gimesia sp.]|nr:hypothetical protein [Gimesia sp.]